MKNVILLVSVRPTDGRYNNIVCYFDVKIDGVVIKNFFIRENKNNTYQFSYPGKWAPNGQWLPSIIVDNADVRAGLTNCALTALDQYRNNIQSSETRVTITADTIDNKADTEIKSNEQKCERPGWIDLPLVKASGKEIKDFIERTPDETK